MEELRFYQDGNTITLKEASGVKWIICLTLTLMLWQDRVA
jgi:hypothetical protein